MHRVGSVKRAWHLPKRIPDCLSARCFTEGGRDIEFGCSEEKIECEKSKVHGNDEVCTAGRFHLTQSTEISHDSYQRSRFMSKCIISQKIGVIEGTSPPRRVTLIVSQQIDPHDGALLTHICTASREAFAFIGIYTDHLAILLSVRCLFAVVS